MATDSDLHCLFTAPVEEQHDSYVTRFQNRRSSWERWPPRRCTGSHCSSRRLRHPRPSQSPTPSKSRSLVPTPGRSRNPVLNPDCSPIHSPTSGAGRFCTVVSARSRGRDACGRPRTSGTKATASRACGGYGVVVPMRMSGSASASRWTGPRVVRLRGDRRRLPTASSHRLSRLVPTFALVRVGPTTEHAAEGRLCRGR